MRGCSDTSCNMILCRKENSKKIKVKTLEKIDYLNEFSEEYIS